jgi:hypothetical protein
LARLISYPSAGMATPGRELGVPSPFLKIAAAN